MKFKDLRLGTKQMLGFGFILMIMAGVNFFSISKMATIKSEIDDVSNNWLPRAIAISDINLNTSFLRLNQLQHAFAIDEHEKQQQAEEMIELITKIDENLDTYETLKQDSEGRDLYSQKEKSLYEQFDQKWDRYQELSFAFFKLSRDNQTKDAVALLTGEAQNVFNDFGRDLVKLVEVSKRDAYLAAERAEETFNATRTINRILLGATVLLSFFVAAILVRLITVPLKQLVDAAGRVEKGDLDVKLNIAQRDEIGKLAFSFNQMTSSLREANEKMQQQARLREEAAKQRARAKEAEAKILKAENDRKTHELKEARRLQLSMLPLKNPELPNLEIAAFMQPATEVGGDYYDFKLDEDGTLTIAIGDATGHGTKAGIVVTAVKSLFEVLADSPNILEILKKISLTLRRMNLGGKIFMALTLAKFKDNKLKIASAGMPLPLVWRNREQRVEEVELKGMPLGSVANYEYQEKEIYLNAGDSVVFMSDGLPEMMNPEGETLDYPTMKKLIEEGPDKSPQKMIAHLVESGKKWANGRPQDDDVTFVALRVK